MPVPVPEHQHHDPDALHDFLVEQVRDTRPGCGALARGGRGHFRRRHDPRRHGSPRRHGRPARPAAWVAAQAEPGRPG
ncbi:hypothetical protein [Streptomyces narbonensis]|uniref:hypothetical protein n=1 Tax=Streptomyces narbonensis TaxID=67333 RepID=UPI001675074C|nr:hypothetical protein [Streptomyces narbonensis]